jgi:hypothetical protein
MALCVIFATTMHAQLPTPLEVAQQQLDAYNAQDIDAFVATFAPDAAIYMRLGDEAPHTVGSNAIRTLYGNLFKNHPQNRSILMGRMVEGNYVIDHEYLTGREKPVTIVAIYEIEDGLIRRCWFIR